MNTAADIPLLITSENSSSSERRVTPSWSISHLKARLEPITGIPASCQKLSLRIASQAPQPIEAADEDTTQLFNWPLHTYAEIHAYRIWVEKLGYAYICTDAQSAVSAFVSCQLEHEFPQDSRLIPGSSPSTVKDTRPPGARANYTDVSKVEKYELPPAEYESRTDSVLAWKKKQKLGRFDPNAASIEQQKIDASYREVEQRKLTVGSRCRLLPDSDARRGEVMYVGDVSDIPSGIGAWVGVKLDEPTGKNDGTVKGKRYFECAANCGVLVRPERVETGDFPILDEFADEDEEF